MTNHGLEVDESEYQARPTFEDALTALEASSDAAPDDVIIVGLSEITAAQAAQLQDVWNALDVSYRQILMDILIDEMQTNFELAYDELGLMSLTDDDARIRRSAVELLGESQSLDVLTRIVDMFEHDISPIVRAEAMRTMGNFILLDELGDLPEESTLKAQKLALSAYRNRDEDVEVRARALEAIACTNRSGTSAMIREAYNSGDDALRLGAIVAMGRTADTDKWGEIVLEELDTTTGELRLEAARACGELQVEGAIPLLANLLEESDRETKRVVIWSLGEIGGKEAIRILGALSELAEDEGDEELLEEIDNATANASVLDGQFLDMAIDD